MSQYEDDDDRTLYFDQTGAPVTVGDARRMAEHRQQATEAFWADLYRLLFAELDADQLGSVLAMLKTISEGGDAHGLAAYFEGLLRGALEARKRADEAAQSPVAKLAEGLETMWSHAFATNPKKLGHCGRCGLPANGKPHARWDAGLTGDGSDGEDVG